MTLAIANESKAKKYRLVVVDDHAIVRHGLSVLITRESDMEICGQAASVNQGVQQVESTRPDIVIVDISLEGGSGLQLIQRIKSRFPQVKMLVSSVHDEMIFAPRALRAGAQGYINKRESVETLIDAVRQVLRGEVYLSPRMASRLLHRSAVGEPLDDDPTACLTNRELEVFEMIGQGLDARQIAEYLGLSPGTIETHSKSIKAKLNLQDSLQLNRYAFLWAQENH